MSPPIIPQNGTELSDLQLGRFREVFEIFDADKSGAICIKELGVVMRALGQEADDEELEDIMKEFDENNDGVISFNEFVEIMKERIKTHEEEQEHELHEAFQVFDKDGDGYITVSELREFFHGIGEIALTDVDIKEMIKAADVDNDGQMDYFEFRKMMLKNREIDEKGHEGGLVWPPNDKKDKLVNHPEENTKKGEAPQKI